MANIPTGVPPGSLIGQQLASTQGPPGALVPTRIMAETPQQVKQPPKKKGKGKKKKGKRPPPAESLYG